MNERIELLAPARDLETGTAAINCGADAVYIGAAKFGAREAAGNSLDDLERLIGYAHRYWARVYVTLNTLLRDEEVEAAQALVYRLEEIGADALIIQDTALLQLDLPPLPLFASTQMHNHTPERVAFLEQVGIRRAILARELSLEQIRAIRAQTHLELETFVHGALCVSYSGQCYLSYALGGRSGNRGQCAQPCRRPYTLIDGNGKTLRANAHYLSLRDLNLSNDLAALLDAGVTSFKIEGRLKDKAYVMNVTGAYRQQLDALLAGRSQRAAASGKVIFDFQPNLKKTFQRGYTTYFLHGRAEPVGSLDTPKATGELVGRVSKLGARDFTLDGSVEIQRGDGLCFLNAQRELAGSAVNDVQGRRITLERMEGLTAGAQVYRNHDHAFHTALEKSQTERKINVRFRLASTARGLALFAQDEDGNEAMQSLETEWSPAEKPEAALATIEKQLGKLGGTPFACSFVRIDVSPAPFVPVGLLNNLRREVLAALEAERLANYPRWRGGAVKNDVPYPTTTLTFTGNVLNRHAEAFYRRHGVTEIQPAAESGVKLEGKLVMTTKHCIKHQLGWCARYGGKTQPHAEPLALLDEHGTRLPLRFRCDRCEMEVYFQSR